MKDDYSDVILSQGLVCKNTNNNTYCVVIDGRRGSEKDRESLTLEFWEEDGFILNCPPNRALKPTGKVCRLDYLAKVLRQHVSFD